MTQRDSAPPSSEPQVAGEIDPKSGADAAREVSTEAAEDADAAAAEQQANGAAESAPPGPPAANEPARLRVWLALLFVLLGAGVTLLVMANDEVWRASPIVVFIACGLAVIGLLRLLGVSGAVRERITNLGSLVAAPSTADDPVALGVGAQVPAVVHPARFLASLAVFIAVGWGAVRGVYPLHRFTAALLLTLACLWLVVESFRLIRAVGAFGPDPNGEDRPLLRRHGFWLMVLSSVLYLPLLGNFGLIDPWETHYGEVAREMIARDDWVSLWWAHDGWFWSKPVLNFWLQGLSFKLFGIDAAPDQILAGVSQGFLPQPEWACRLPIFFMTVIGGWVLYRAMIAPLGRRAAFLGSVLLITCPYWYILARQTMADMPYVAPLCAAMGLLLLGFQTDPEARLREYHVEIWRWRFRFTALHLLLGSVLMLVLPQVIYLITRNVTFHTADLFGFRLHLDEFEQGSGGGNCGQPGNKRCKAFTPVHEWGQPAAWALVWLGCALGLVIAKRKERRTQRLYFLSAWLCVALAIMAKGAPGLVLPLGVALVFVGVSGRWRDLARLELPALGLMLLAIALPWYVQMYMRHGQPFFERLIMHDMVKRAFVHVHDTNKGDDVSFRYYVWQLGYGLFPWTGLCAGGLIWWIRERARTLRVEREAILFLLVWWLLAFGMFSITLTKFHHYIFPLVPPMAMLTGIMLERYAPQRLPQGALQSALYLGLVSLGLGAIVLGVVAYLPGSFSSEVLASGELEPPRRWLGTGLGVLGLALLVIAYLRYGRGKGDADGSGPGVEESVALSVVAIASAIGVGLAGRDMFITRKGDVDGPARIIHLFTYNYDRVFPDTLDFRPSLFAFTLLAVTVSLLLAVPRLRRFAAVSMFCVGGLYSAWLMGVYLMQIAPHWGQRETMLAYYQHRSEPKEQLVAYQMNWKGENFYTGNYMATFVSSGTKFKQWIKKQQQQGNTTLYFTTEHSRVGSLKRELGSTKAFEVLTDERLNNKFFLARVELAKLAKPSKASAKRPAEARDKTQAGEAERLGAKGRAQQPTRGDEDAD